ncbi:hypothetical protein ACLMJK_009293 [Lecanora helva]
MEYQHFNQLDHSFDSLGGPNTQWQLPSSNFHEVVDLTARQPSHTAFNHGSHSYLEPFEQQQLPNNAGHMSGRQRGHQDSPQNRVGPFTSKRAEKRAKVIAEHGAVGANDIPKGYTRGRRGNLEWWDAGQGEWRSAAPLDDYRHMIIEDDNARDFYDHTPEHGQHEDDVTTFPLVDQIGMKHWFFFGRDNMGNIVDAEDNQVMLLDEKPETYIMQPRPGCMMYRGKIMLDPDDHPIIDWPGVPRCISSQIEGWRIEAMRRVFPWIALSQFRARMPRYIHKKMAGVRPLFGMSSLTQRLGRFRDHYNIIPWKKGKGPDSYQYTRPDFDEDYFESNSAASLQPVSWKVSQQNRHSKGRSPDYAAPSLATEEHYESMEGRQMRRVEQMHERDQEYNPNYRGNRSTKRKRDDFEVSESRASTLRPNHVASAHPGAFSQTKESPAQGSICNAYPERAHGNGRTSAEGRSTNQQFRSNTPDLRDVPPRTLQEQLSIKIALVYTIADYRHWNSTEPPSTTSTSSYLSQYRELQTSHCIGWLGPNAAPQLVGLSEWLGTFDSVPIPRVGDAVLRRLLPSFGDAAVSSFDGNASQSHHGDDFAFDEAVPSNSWQNIVPLSTSSGQQSNWNTLQRVPQAIPEDSFRPAAQPPNVEMPRNYKEVDSLFEGSTISSSCSLPTNPLPSLNEGERHRGDTQDLLEQIPPNIEDYNLENFDWESVDFDNLSFPDEFTR